MKRYRKVYSQREAASLDRELKRLKNALRDGLTGNSVAVGEVQLTDVQKAIVKTAFSCNHIVIVSGISLRVAKLPEVAR